MIDAAKKASIPKLFFVCYNYWDLYNFRFDVVNHFAKLGCEIHTAAIKDKYAEQITAIGCTTHFISFSNRSINPLKDLFFMLSLKRLYKKIKPDIIFHYAIKPNIYGSIAASQLHIRSVAIVTGLGYPFAKNNWLALLVRKLYRYALKNVSEVFLLNEEDKNLFIQNKIVSSHKVKLLHSEGINTERFTPSVTQKEPHVFTFLMATRMIWSKGVGVFAKASELLKKKGYVFECKVIGFFETDHPDSISRQALAEWEHKKLLSYAGFFDDVKPFFAKANCFVLPTYYHEGVPRSLLEACAMQLPCITTNNSGCKEVIKDGYNGFICAQNNAEDLCVKMEKMLNLNLAQLKAMGENGRRIVLENFSIQKILWEYNKLVFE